MLLNKGYDRVDKEKMVPGFTTSRKTRPLIIEKMERFAEEKELIIRSERLYNELTTFI